MNAPVDFIRAGITDVVVAKGLSQLSRAIESLSLIISGTKTVP